MSKPRQLTTRISDDALWDAVQRHALQHFEGNESQTVRLALRNLLMPTSTTVSLPLPGRDKESPLQAVKPKGGKGSITRFLEQYGEHSDAD